MSKSHAYLALAATLMTACTVIPKDSSQYAHSQSPIPAYSQPLNASYNSAQTAAVDPDCRRRETNRELLGGAIGGAAGAYAGEKLIGGTKGAVAGAVVGGVAGYGIGDISTNCAPPASNSYAPATRSNAVYQSAPTYSATQASHASLSCPVGTTPHSSGTCLLNDPNASLQSASVQTAPTQTQQQSYQQYAPAPRASNVIAATTAPSAPSSYTGTDVTRAYGGTRAYGESRAYGGTGYRVKPGDTVYSLSRNLCVPVTAIQTSNGLDANFGIQIGQILTLPTSQC